MESETEGITLERMILRGLDGKDRALAAYDDMLWKIRTGYAAVLYGVFTLVVSLGDNANWGLSLPKAAWVALTLITGFTICAAVLDFAFLKSKFLVVQTKEELVGFALSTVKGVEPVAWTGTPLKTLLHNSGEGRTPVRWKDRPSVAPIVLLYLGTWLPLCLAVVIMWV